MEFYRCAKCKFYMPQIKTCQIMIPAMQGKINPEDYCSKCMTEIVTCEICGSGILTPFIEYKKDKEPHVYCFNCLNQKNNTK